MKRLLGVVNVLPYLIKVVLFVVEMSRTSTSYLKREGEKKEAALLLCLVLISTIRGAIDATISQPELNQQNISMKLEREPTNQPVCLGIYDVCL